MIKYMELNEKVRSLTFFNLSRGHLSPYACTRARFNKRMTTFYNYIII